MFKRRIEASTVTCMFVLLVFATVIYVQAQTGTLGRGGRPVLPAAVVDYDLEFRGHVVLQGAPQGGGVCSYPYFAMKIRAVRSRSRSLKLQSNPSTCQLTVAEKRDQSRNEIQSSRKSLVSQRETKRIGRLVPNNSIEKIQNAIARLSFHSPEQFTVSYGLTTGPTVVRTTPRRVAVARPLNDCYTTFDNFSVDDIVQMIGAGGDWDVLTEKDGAMSVDCGPDDDVAILYQDGSCWWDAVTFWSNDSCSFDFADYGPSLFVDRAGEGAFHWIGGLYSHALGDGEEANYDGYVCTSWYSGSVVSAVIPHCESY